MVSQRRVGPPPAPRRRLAAAGVVAIAAASGVAAASAGAHPTGRPAVDAILTAVVAALITWAAATAPWWATAIVAGLAAAGASAPVAIAAGIAGAAVALWCGARRIEAPWLGAIAAGAGVQAMLRLDVRGFLGLSALLVGAASVVLILLGLGRRCRRARRWAWIATGALAACAVLAAVGLGVSAETAKGSLERGNSDAHAALDALDAGDMPAAAASFRSAAAAFHSADRDLSSLIAQPSRLLPVVAQHRRSASTLSASAAAAMSAAAAAIARIDPSTVQVVGGRIDLAAVSALVGPFTELRNAIATMEAAIDDTRSPWLVGPLQRRLTSLRRDLEQNGARADTALRAVRLAPDMLGATAPRRYFIGFTTPAEARGLGGFMGNWGEVTITDGTIAMTGFGRTGQLSAGGTDPEHRRLTIADPDVLRRWGRFGLVRADGTASPLAWDNITMPPDFPTVAALIAQLYPQSGGHPIDGVFMLDPDAVAALMSFTGPVDVPGVGVPLTSTNAAQFITSGQYSIPSNDQRIDLLDAIATATVQRLLGSSLPPPADLAQTFAPLAKAGHFAAWSAVPGEEAFLTGIGLGDAFPALAGGDGVAVTVDNAAANKIDPYLHVDTTYAAIPTGVGATTEATLTVTMTNTAPATGLPEYVIGNAIGLPSGTSRTWVSVYTALPMTSATLDGGPAALEADHVFGWNVAAQFVTLAPGQRRVSVLHLRGSLADASAPLVTPHQPLVVPATVTVARR